MEKEQATKIIEDNLDQMVNDFCLEEWKIVVALDMPEGAPDNAAGVVLIEYPYKLAQIHMNLEHCPTEEHLLGTLFHEMMHIVLAPYDNYATFTKETARNKYEMGMLDHADMIAAEKTVFILEQILKYRLGYIYPSNRKKPRKKKTS